MLASLVRLKIIHDVAKNLTSFCGHMNAAVNVFHRLDPPFARVNEVGFHPEFASTRAPLARPGSKAVEAELVVTRAGHMVTAGARIKKVQEVMRVSVREE